MSMTPPTRLVLRAKRLEMQAARRLAARIALVDALRAAGFSNEPRGLGWNG